MSLPELLYFDDLVKLRLVKNWTTLNRWIESRGFPTGNLCGRCRIWTRASVFQWIESQPTKNTAPLKGFAKANADRAGPRDKAVRQ